MRPPSTMVIRPMAALSSSDPREDEDVALPEGIPMSKCMH